MREIKFRAWDSKTKIMYQYAKLSFDGRVEFCFNGTPKKVSQHPGDFTEYKEEGRIIAMQYTGLKDKNGKEIYEGDIIHYKHETGFETWDEMNEEVKFENGMFSCAVYSNFEECDGEVIGNIYENPELIK